MKMKTLEHTTPFQW